jgi:hypothetical protein
LRSHQGHYPHSGHAFADSSFSVNSPHAAHMSRISNLSPSPRIDSPWRSPEAHGHGGLILPFPDLDFDKHGESTLNSSLKSHALEDHAAIPFPQYA